MDRDLRRDLKQLIAAALAAVDPRRIIGESLNLDGDRLSVGGLEYDLSAYRKIIVIGSGKAGAPMAAALEELLGDRIAAGLVVVKDGYGLAGLSRIELAEAAHPLPDERGAGAARRLLELAQAAAPGDLVICLISGGGSALMALPAGDLTLAELQLVTMALINSGATITEINAVRKHLTLAAGGAIAAAAFPATVLSLIISDVIGDRLDAIASGPTVPDNSTFSEALAALDRYGLRTRVPAAALAHLEAGLRGERAETPKPGDPVFAEVAHVVLSSNRVAVAAAAAAADRLGYHVLNLTALLEGEARELAQLFAALAREEEEYGRPLPLPACILAGGETTVTVRGGGRGGRAQEFALAAALKLGGLNRSLVFAFGTDGTDGPTDAAGAQAAGDSLARASAAGLEARRHLDDNDAYPLFQRLGDLIVTGPTGTNVNDIYGVLVG